MICEEERQALISELMEAQDASNSVPYHHKEHWKQWWEKQGGDIILGLHDLVFGVDSEKTPI